MTTLERVRLSHMVEKMGGTSLKWFGHVDFVVRRIDPCN